MWPTDDQVVLGLHIVRGDNICVVGEIDEELDQRLGNSQHIKLRTFAFFAILLTATKTNNLLNLSLMLLHM